MQEPLQSHTMDLKELIWGEEVTVVENSSGDETKEVWEP